MTDPIAAFLDHFLLESTPAHSAVLLTGTWGSGKSHFLKDYLARRDARMKALEPMRRPHLYVSLYGVRSADDISSRIYAQANPLLNSTAARLVGTVVARAANAFTNGAAFAEGDAKALQALATNLRDVVLVFDDLERCAMPINDVLGEINTYVEHEKLKVIIVASEGDVPKSQRSEYLRRKEKVVGKTLAVRSDAGSVYDHFVDHMTSDTAQGFARLFRAEALEVFRETGTSNFRSLRAVLEDFDRIVAVVEPRLKDKPDASRGILQYMIATGVEMRAGRLKAEDFEQLAYSYYMSPPRDADADDEKHRLSRFVARYRQIPWTDPLVPPGLLARLFASGELDGTGIDLHLQQHPWVAGGEDVPSWRRLWHWFELDVTAYASARASVLADLAALTLTHPAHIMHVAGTLITLRDFGDDLTAPLPLVDYFESYLAELGRTDTLQPLTDVARGINVTGFDGLGYSSIEKPDFALVRTALTKATDMAFERRMKADAKHLLVQLSEQSRYNALYDSDLADGNYGGAPILHNMPVVEFADLLLTSGRLDDALLTSLSLRYQHHRHDRPLQIEKAWLEALRDELVARAAALPPPQKRHLTERLTGIFEKVLSEFAPPSA